MKRLSVAVLFFCFFCCFSFFFSACGSGQWGDENKTIIYNGRVARLYFSKKIAKFN